MLTRHTAPHVIIAVVASLTAACGGGKEPTAPPVAAVTMSRDTATLVPTATLQLSAIARDAAGNALSSAVSWSSSDQSKAIVSPAGLVTGVAPGSASITATAGGRSASTQLTVKEGALVGGNGGTVTALGGVATLTVPAGAVTSNVMITIEPVANAPATPRLVGGTAIELGPPGQQLAAPVQLRLRYSPGQVPTGASEELLQLHRVAGGAWQPVTGSSVDVSAKIVTANLTSFSTYSILASAVASVSLSADAAALEEGATLQLVATARDAANAVVVDAPINWSSANRAIASVSPQGLVTAVAPGGPVLITAESNGKSSTASITVKPKPGIRLSASTVVFSADIGAPDPASQDVAVTSAGDIAVTGLSVSVAYDAGQTSGWLDASLGSTNPPTSLTLHAKTGSLALGTYAATVTVTSAVQGVAPQSLRVTFVVGGAQPTIALSTTTASFVGTTGGANPAPTTVDVTNGGGATLSGLETQVIYPVGEATGWLNATLSGTTAPATIAVQASTVGLASGTHMASIRVSSTIAGVVPGTVAVTLVLSDPSIAVWSGNNQAAMAGSAVPLSPSVITRDATGAPLANVTVTFAVTDGEGSVTNPVVATDANGIAAVGGWILGGVANPNALRATAAGPGFTSGNNSVAFKATGCTGGGGIGYAITLCFVTPMTSTQRAAFVDAAARWSTLIVGDLPDEPPQQVPASTCGPNSPSMNMSIDDLVIFARIESIDGAHGVLGTAGPCYIRDEGFLTVIGQMRFDNADVPTLEANSQLRDVILHEMGHVIGVGSLWPDFGLLINPSTKSTTLDTYFSGVNAIDAFNQIGGATYTLGQKVPVENTGGPGTINGHWRESVLANELMTGFINAGGNPLSAVTVRSLQDLGYTVNAAAADPFHLTLSLQSLEASAAQGRAYGDDIIRGPYYKIDKRGRIVRLR